jgi:UDP-N-acetylmuramoyl-L-alanyl-D-glutamate--2,6-diaminopimelate ligase
MKLRVLLQNAGIRTESQVPDIEVSGVSCDSRRLAPDNVFIALQGDTTDGSRFIDTAAMRGACAVVLEDAARAESSPIPVIPVEDARRALASMSARFHDTPSWALKVAGITGTNGKTTTACLLQAALEASSLPAGILGTLGYETGQGSYAAHHTTPLADSSQALMAEMRDAGKKACVMEVSSHALVQGRVDEIRFACGIFTNLSRDHLDYHGSMAEYLDAKAELFRRLPRNAVAILNSDDPASEVMASETRARVVTFGTESSGDYRARIHRMDAGGSEVEVRTPLGSVDVTTPLLGCHNLSNMLGALAGAMALGADPETAAAGLSGITHVPGRLERLFLPSPFAVMIDHAHTPEALRQVLKYLRPLVRGHLWLVFGCGGDRDPGKRALMARVAEKYAGSVMVTSDNPRSEHPMSIIRDIMGGFESPREAMLEPDREQAIRIVLGLAREGDVVLIAGKGHECSQLIAERQVPFSDSAVVEAWFDSP